MIWLLSVYALLVVAIGLLDARKARDFDGFVLAGRRRSTATVAASMLASVVGASATLGVVNLARNVGMPAFWWLGSGAIGLVLAGVLIAGRLREDEYRTLADMVGVHFGMPARKLVSFVIVIGWTGITAAQFVAAAKVVSALTGWEYGTSLLLAGGFISAYCTLGGQASVLKTDILQLLMMLGGIAVALCILYGRTGMPEAGITIELVNDKFPLSMFWFFMVVVGSGFIVGPDVFSRLFTARDGATAAGASVISGLMLALVSAAIVAIGLWARYFGDIPDSADTLPYLLNVTIGGKTGAILSFGLLSAIISSADTCMISASTSCEHDLFGGSRIGRVRIITALLGVGAIAIAAGKQEIIPTLVLAYSLFNCGVIPPVLAGLLYRGHLVINRPLIMAAMICGGSLGVAGNIVADGKWLTMSGMGVSVLLTLAAILFGRNGNAGSVSASD